MNYLRPYGVMSCDMSAEESKTRDFQYKILNRILFTNKMLFRMKICDTNKCATIFMKIWMN